MLEIWLLVLPWMADSALAVHTAEPHITAAATCVRPAALIVDIPLHNAMNSSRAPISRSVGEWLEQWELATRHVAHRNRSQSEEFRRQVRDRFNEHIGDAAEQLIGRVRAQQLLDSFRWQIVEIHRNHVRLEAVPRDEIDQLFIGSFQIQLDLHTSVPNELVVAGRDQRFHMVWQLNRDESRQIDLAHFEDSIPPAPVTVLRTADARLE